MECVIDMVNGVNCAGRLSHLTCSHIWPVFALNGFRLIVVEGE